MRRHKLGSETHHRAMNDLDRAILAIQRSPAEVPELYRQLTTGELCFLLPYHPELEVGDRMAIENGSPFPFCVQTQPDGEEVVLLFSSEARVDESLRKSDAPPNKFLCGAMPAVQVLELVGKMGFRAVLNRGCATGEITLPAELLCDLADGSIFQTTSPGESIQMAVQTLDPADYPTDLIQSTFEFIRKHPAFRAAWVILLAGAGGTQKYQLLLLMSPQDQTLLHDLNLALNCMPPKGLPFELGTVDEHDTVQVMTLFAKAQPFYLAQDFTRPKH
jgi:hypothetical protein